MKQRIITALICMIAAAFLGGVAVLYAAHKTYHAAGALPEAALFVVERGESLHSISEKLLYIGAFEKVEHSSLFYYGARLTEKAQHIKAGEYELPAGSSMSGILEILTSGKTYQRQITFPEGLTSWQIVNILNAQEFLTGEITEIPADGSLLPETYSYQRGATRQSVLDRMQSAATKTLAELWAARQDNLPLETPAQALVLASIVEKETAVAAERPRVAGVFINRLRKGMKLQSDPTVIYAMTEGRIQDDGQGPIGRRLLKKDLQIDSPYNTYRYEGLPPAPIANVGHAAIYAVLNPEKHDYLYFVADGTGGHVFAKTLDGHNRNVAAWRKIRREMNK